MARFHGLLLSLLLLAGLISAINLVAPESRVVGHGDEIYLGDIGPGQTIELRLDPTVGEGGLHGTGGLYDTAVAVEEPIGWGSTRSPLYSNPIWVTLTADPDAEDGDYWANITVIDENYGEKLDNVTFAVRVTVKWDVLDMSVSPALVTTGPGQPAVYQITVTNKGAASDDYYISSTGARRWAFRKPVFIPARGSRTISYEMVANDEESYRPEISVVSRSSANIHKEQNVTFTVRSDLIGDMRAVNNGVMLFPVFEAPIYALAGLLSNFFP